MVEQLPRKTQVPFAMSLFYLLEFLAKHDQGLVSWETAAWPSLQKYMLIV